MSFIAAYAPHSGYSLNPGLYRLGTIFKRTRANKGKFVMGDLNSRLHKPLRGEDAIIGPYVFGNRNANVALSSNPNSFSNFALHMIWLFQIRFKTACQRNK